MVAIFLGDAYEYNSPSIVGALVKTVPVGDESKTDSYRLVLQNNSDREVAIHGIRRPCGQMLRVVKMRIPPGDKGATEFRLPRKFHVFLREDLRVSVEDDLVRDHQIPVYR